MKQIGVMVMICFLNFATVQAQVVTDVPPTTGNDRFFDEIYSSMKRPGLSVAGFDNGGNHSKGYGLKQVLEKLYNNSVDPLMIKSYNEIVKLANEDLIDPFNVPNQSPLKEGETEVSIVSETNCENFKMKFSVTVKDTTNHSKQ